MIGSSVVPGLPNRCVMPSSFNSARKAERPVMRFFMRSLLCPRLLPSRSAIVDDHRGAAQWTAVMAAMRCASDIAARQLEGIIARAFFPFRALPDPAGKALQGDQRRAGIGPFLQLLDGVVVERLAAGAALEQRARDIDHVR